MASSGPAQQAFQTLNSLPASSPAPSNTNPGGGQVLGANTTNTASTGSTGGTSGLGGTQLNAPLYIQGIQQEYGATLNNAPVARNILQNQEGAQTQLYNDQAGAAIANAQQQNQGNQAILQNQIASTQKGQNLSLQELANQIRAQYQGLGSQLGAAGAGSSSAMGVGARGLAEEQNTSRANIENQAGANISSLQTQQSAQNQDAATLIAGYQKTAASQVAQVKANYADLMNKLSVALDQAQGEEKARLAEFGQNLTDSARQSLAAIETNLQNNTQALLTQGTASLSQGSLPTVQSVAPVTYQAPNPNGSVSAAPTNATSSGAPAGGSLYSILQNQQQQPLM
jgi:hypothetical protein